MHVLNALKLVKKGVTVVLESVLVVTVKQPVVPVVNLTLIAVVNVEERLVLVLIVIVIAKLAVVLADVEAVRKVVVLLVVVRVRPTVLVPPIQVEL